jgi:streptomycin 6-kinase
MSLVGLASFPGGAEWIARVPQLTRECAWRWSLDLGEPFADANVSVVYPAGDVVLKISFPHWESEHEPDALRHWEGHGAVRLLDYDAERHALLLERCQPGSSLLDVPERESFRHAAAVLRQLNAQPLRDSRPFRRFADTATRWVSDLPRRWEEAGHPFERELLDAAVAALIELPETEGELVVCSQDFHRGNILAAEREPWLAIDPKPVLAERELGAVALVRDGDGALEWRLDFLAAELDLDRDRLRRWTIAHTIAWGFHETEATAYPAMIDIARRLLRL